jgi:hypothetical protein
MPALPLLHIRQDVNCVIYITVVERLLWHLGPKDMPGVQSRDLTMLLFDILPIAALVVALAVLGRWIMTL